MMNFLVNKPINLQNPDDLMANQRGEISASQNALLTASVGWQNGCAGVVLALFFVPFFFFMAIFAFEAASDTLIFGLVILFALLVFGGLVLSQTRGILDVWRRWNALKQDRENRAIRQGQGHLIFSKNRYAVDASGRELILPNSTNAGGLTPGATYRFYYLEESGFVLSAEELFPASASQSRNALLEILAEANKFSMEDLALNRNGEIGPSQRNKALPNLFMGIFFAGLPLFFIFLMFTSFGNEDNLIALIVPIIFLAIFGLAGGAISFNAVRDLLAHGPLVAEGEGHKEKRTSRGRNRRTTYYYSVDGTLFTVSKTAYEALVDGEQYRIYALPHTKRLLTIEPL